LKKSSKSNSSSNRPQHSKCNRNRTTRLPNHWQGSY